MTETVYIGLGSNLGDREGNLLAAVAALRSIDDAAVLQCSSLYESAPLGPPQPRYLNAVVELACGLAPLRLLGILKQIEAELGRTPSQRWGPRAIDLDVLIWEGRVVAEPSLQIPHLDLHQRRFVLEPLCEVRPDVRHPVLGVSAAELLRKLTRQDVTPFDGVHWRSTSRGVLEPME